MVTGYDSWHPDHGAVENTDIITVPTGNADKARDMVQRLPTVLARPTACAQRAATRLTMTF
tara:strand:- start:499 stop:681 length:183 start_codon:yes stop_codon:yes gene_type:complete